MTRRRAWWQDRTAYRIHPRNFADGNGDGVGGFRMDVIDLIGKDIDRGLIAEGPFLHGFLQECTERSWRAATW
ncbi:hypothetical protein [Paracoccus lichenicola]|uniref:hypothetical protein n=1 Tax=Paracoccus lichenicola TaxID=2665644 RepID=UPI0018A9F655|nr:hypothetical protein [Paracoccus lichenicola]